MNTMRALDLATQRTAKDISLGWIESSTRISLEFLRAIEDEDFARLPGGIYSISYLRQYAREIGFDEAALLRRYHEVMEPESPTAPVPNNGTLLRWLFNREPLRAFFGHPNRKHA
jgi:cytoskeletal protein RodZ